MSTLTKRDIATVLDVLRGPREVAWKKIPSLPGRFEASDDGRVRTLSYETTGSHGGEPFTRRMPERILKPRINKSRPSRGVHPVVSIYCGNTRQHMNSKEKRVALLVASAFHGLPYDPSDQRQIQRWKIRFRDDDPMNCCADNLEWVYNAGPVEDDKGEKLQTTYEKNLDAWNAQEPSAILSRLFADYEEDAA